MTTTQWSPSQGILMGCVTSSCLLLQTMSEKNHLKHVQTCSNMLVESCVHPITCWLQGGSRPSSLFGKSPSKGVTSAISGRSTEGTKHYTASSLRWCKMRYLWRFCGHVTGSLCQFPWKLYWLKRYYKKHTARRAPKKHTARRAPSFASLRMWLQVGPSHWCGHRCLGVTSTGQVAGINGDAAGCLPRDMPQHCVAFKVQRQRRWAVLSVAPGAKHLLIK